MTLHNRIRAWVNTQRAWFSRGAFLPPAKRPCYILYVEEYVGQGFDIRHVCDDRETWGDFTDRHNDRDFHLLSDAAKSGKLRGDEIVMVHLKSTDRGSDYHDFVDAMFLDLAAMQPAPPPR